MKYIFKSLLFAGMLICISAVSYAQDKELVKAADNTFLETPIAGDVNQFVKELKSTIANMESLQVSAQTLNTFQHL